MFDNQRNYWDKALTYYSCSSVTLFEQTKAIIDQEFNYYVKEANACTSYDGLIAYYEGERAKLTPKIDKLRDDQANNLTRQQARAACVAGVFNTMTNDRINADNNAIGV